jgi:hypothetical protein
MSEYQYYEFRAIDRPLDQKEMDALRALSTRAEITPTSFTNTYHWGDFKGKPDVLMDRYFDAFVYVANWGTHRLMFRIPEGFLDAEAASAYGDGEVLTLEAKKAHVVLEFLSQDESGDEWSEEEDWMSSLIPLRAELMRGDFRALYLGWLASLPSHGWDSDEADLDALEPPVPPGLAKLSAPLRELAEFLRIEDELIEVAASASGGEPPAGPSRDDLARWIGSLSAFDKESYLLRFLEEEGDIRLRAELSKRFREAPIPKRAMPGPAAERRTVAHLLAARDALVEDKDIKEKERAARERARRDREQAEARAKSLDELARRESTAWREVESLIATKRPGEYDRAVTMLVDLRDLAARSGRTAEAESRIQEVRRRNRNKPSLMKLFDKHRLGE